MLNYIVAQTENDYSKIEMMSSIIWPICYKEILSTEQIKYMLDKFLSKHAINEAKKEGYSFEIILDNNTVIGFISTKLEENRLFLSKLYILPNFQNKGYASMIIKNLKSLYNLPIYLTVNKYNNNAIIKYKHLGFKEIDSIVSDIGNGYVMDDYVLELK